MHQGPAVCFSAGTAAQALVANAGQETAAVPSLFVKVSHPLAKSDFEILKYV